MPEIAVRALREHGVFKLPGLLKLQRKIRPERASSTKNICDRAVVLPHLDSRLDVKCTVLNALVQQVGK